MNSKQTDKTEPSVGMFLASTEKPNPRKCIMRYTSSATHFCNCLNSLTTFLKAQTADLQNISLTEAIVAQPQNFSFGVNTMIELENITTSNNNDIQRGIFQLTSLPIFLMQLS